MWPWKNNRTIILQEIKDQMTYAIIQYHCSIHHNDKCRKARAGEAWALYQLYKTFVPDCRIANIEFIQKDACR